MRAYFFLVLLILCGQVIGQDYYNSEELIVDLEIANSFTIVPQSPDYSIDSINVYLSFVPAADDRQDVITQMTEPFSRQDGDGLVFSWENPAFTEAGYSLSSQIRTRDHLVKVTDKQSFPFRAEGVAEYLKETDHVDFSDPGVRKLAQELASGEDDAYVVVHKFSEWVNKNIKYDLNTVTADASQTASWVLDNRIGVCDELTNLFLGLCRSVGIPAKFVSGIAYTTDDRFAEPWTSHGWAEVYFLDYGWIPFDVTYGQFGYIDPTHIKLKEAEDADKSGTRYEWRARDAEIKTGSLDMDASVVSAKGVISPLLMLDADVVHGKVTPGSYDILEVVVKNPNGFYVPTEIRLSRTEELEMLDPYDRFILMEPQSEKTLFYRFRIDEDLQSNFVYTFMVSAETSRGAKSEAKFLSMHAAATLLLADAEDYTGLRSMDETYTYSKYIGFECRSARDSYYEGENAIITCDVHNSGSDQKEMDFCVSGSCQVLLLEPSATRAITGEQMMSIGQPQPLIVLSAEDVHKTSQLALIVHEKPAISITNMTMKDNPSYSEDFDISFLISRGDKAPVENIVVSMTGAGIDKRWVVDDLGDGQAFSLKIAKHSLPAVENKLVASVDYSDTLGRKYHSEQEIDVLFAPLTLKERAIMLANAGGAWILQHVLLSVLIAGGIVFGLALASIFRRRG